MNQLTRRILFTKNNKILSSFWRSFNTNEDSSKNERSKRNFKLFFGAAAAITGFGLYKISEKHRVYAASITALAGQFRSDYPIYTLEQVSLHNSPATGIWVVFKQGVYDITKFVSNHPGGEIITLAAGTSVEPFWMMYGIHHDEKILLMLETMRIGNISEEEAKVATSNMSDPYVTDPRRDPVLIPASKKPFNAEPVPALLVDSFITPNEKFFVRNHLPVPVVDPRYYELEIELEGKNKILVLNLDQLKKLPKHTVTSTIMCAGNRRSDMNKVKQVKGLNWGHTAVSNAVWSGPRLRDVLISMGITDEDTYYKHVQFEGLDTDPKNAPYGSSISFHKAMDKHGDVILAYEMNGAPLPHDHGYPVRAIVPGVVGARNVKWLGRIVVSPTESEAFWQQNDYKGFSPSVDWDTVDFTTSPAIQELPVISAICVPETNETVRLDDGCVLVKGYAWSGGGHKIIRVDVTGDCGKTWHVADLTMQDGADAPKHWTWTLWTAKIPVSSNSKKVEIWAKAVDSNYNTQPETFENIWNLRGVLSNAYHRILVNIDSKKK